MCNLPKRVLIAGKWWALRKFTKAEDQETAKAGPGEVFYGKCFHNEKVICYRSKQHPEELLDTLVHEGVHAILSERTTKFGDAYNDESVIETLVGDFMTYLKQVAEVKLR
jgi:hypothetical protein